MPDLLPFTIINPDGSRTRGIVCSACQHTPHIPGDCGAAMFDRDGQPHLCRCDIGDVT